MLRKEFERRWSALHAADRFDQEGALEQCWLSHFESLLIDTFRDIFEDAKRNLGPKPAEFAYHTLRDWCLAADAELGDILFDVQNYRDWQGCLQELRDAAASEISPEDTIYKPQTNLCLDTVMNLETNSPSLNAVVHELRPHLLEAMTNILKRERCPTLDDIVAKYPVLRGLQDGELQDIHYTRLGRTPRIASLKLLETRTSVGYWTLERYFRPSLFQPKHRKAKPTPSSTKSK